MPASLIQVLSLEVSLSFTKLVWPVRIRGTDAVSAAVFLRNSLLLFFMEYTLSEGVTASHPFTTLQFNLLTVLYEPGIPDGRRAIKTILNSDNASRIMAKGQ